MYIGDWLGRRAQLSPAKTALIDTIGGRAISYRAWNRAAGRAANLLRERCGVCKGDRVAILAQNCVEYLDLWFACGKLGAVLQTLNWRLTPRELAALVADAAPRALVYGPDFAAHAAAIRAATPVEHAVALDAAARAASDDTAFAEREHMPEATPPVELAWDDPWAICSTGGTTGLPKGAVLTHGNITWNAINTVTSWGLAPEDVAILNTPLFHTGALNVFTAPLVHIGGTTVVCRGFDAGQVYDLIDGAGVTLFFGVPTMFHDLQQHPRWPAADFTRLKLIISGGAPCPAPIREAFWARGVDFKLGYGLTEAGPNTFWLPTEELRAKPGAVGYPLMHIDLRLVDTAGNECAPGTVGELHIRGPHVFAGYLNRPEETARTLVGGWLRTGDLAARDADGCYTIVGRLKDVIISGGENIYPAEVESVLAAHPAVLEAALIGVPDAKWGEAARAVVALRPGASLDVDELLAFCRERLARYKTPRSVALVAALPRTAAGKIDKPALVRAFGGA